MQERARISGIGGIFAVLADVSARPRYAFLVLQLVAEIADGRGQAGPFVSNNGMRILLRDWLCTQLMPMSEQLARRAALRARVIAALAGELSGDPRRDAVRIDQAVEDQALAVGRANVSRAISDLVRAGLMTRHYAGYATNHANRGGGRHAVYVVPSGVLRALGKTTATLPAAAAPAKCQGELFLA